MSTKQEFLVDMFLLEVGEGRMPAEGSPERVAYSEFRLAEVAEKLRVSRNRMAERLRRQHGI